MTELITPEYFNNHVMTLESDRFPLGIVGLPSVTTDGFRHHGMPERLYFVGNPEILKDPSVALIGTSERKKPGPSGVGLQIAGKLGAMLGQSGIKIVSGNASGIDNAGIIAALENNGKIVEFLQINLAVGQLLEVEKRRLESRIVVCYSVNIQMKVIP